MQDIRTSSHIPDALRPVLMAEIDQFSMLFPLSREGYQSTFMQLLDTQFEQKEETSSTIFNDSRNDVQSLAFAGLVRAMMGSLDQNGQNQETDWSLFCRETFNIRKDYQDKGDEFFSSTVSFWNTIKFGPAAVLGSRSYARQVFYHEVGHSLNGMFEREDIGSSLRQLFAPARACLKERQDKISGRGEFYIKEDFADLVATTFLKDSSSRPFACEYFVRDSAGQLYGQTSLTNPTEGDVHSSDFLRALFNSIDRGMALPASCQTALEEAGHPDFQERQCSLF